MVDYASALFARSVEDEFELSEVETIAGAPEVVNNEAVWDHSLVLTMDAKFAKEDRIDLDNDPDGDLRFRESPSDARIKGPYRHKGYYPNNWRTRTYEQR